MWYYGHYFCFPNVQFVVIEFLYVMQTLSFAISRDQKNQCDLEELFQDFRCLAH